MGPAVREALTPPAAPGWPQAVAGGEMEAEAADEVCKAGQRMKYGALTVTGV